MGAEWQAVAELVEQWEPGVVVVDTPLGSAVGIATVVDGVLIVEVAALPVEAFPSCR